MLATGIAPDALMTAMVHCDPSYRDSDWTSVVRTYFSLERPTMTTELNASMRETKVNTLACSLAHLSRSTLP